MATTHLSVYNKTALPNATEYTFAIVTAEWNKEITQNMMNAAIETLLDLGAKKENIHTYDVPGAFELIYASNLLVQQKSIDAVLAIGCVIKGETAHFEYVCSGVTQGIAQLNANQNIPIVFCLLTDNNKQQSLDRSGGKLGNKGTEAAVTAVKMIHFKKKLHHNL